MNTIKLSTLITLLQQINNPNNDINIVISTNPYDNTETIDSSISDTTLYLEDILSPPSHTTQPFIKYNKLHSNEIIQISDNDYPALLD